MLEVLEAGPEGGRRTRTRDTRLDLTWTCHHRCEAEAGVREQVAVSAEIRQHYGSEGCEYDVSTRLSSIFLGPNVDSSGGCCDVPSDGLTSINTNSRPDEIPPSTARCGGCAPWVPDCRLGWWAARFSAARDNSRVPSFGLQF